MYELSGPRFFKFCWRMPAYKSVIRARLENEENGNSSDSSSTSGNFSLKNDRVGGGTASDIANINSSVGKTQGETASLIEYSKV